MQLQSGMRVWYPRPLNDDVLAALRALTPGCIVSRDASPETEMLVEGRPTDADLEAVPRLRWLVVPFAGVPQATLELVRGRSSISLHNLHHNAAQTAETALTLLFAAAKRTVPIDQAMRRNDWTGRYEPDRTMLLERKTCLVLGYGAIGSRVGRALMALGVNVVAIRRRPHSSGEFGMERLRELLPAAQILIVTLPHTPETEGLLGAAELDLLPQGAIIVNVARAQIIDERALFAALQSGALHSAGLDVWYRYPQSSGAAVPGYFQMPESAMHTAPSAFPFHELDNVVMSPHRGGASAGTEELRVQHLARLINAGARAEEVPNRVDPDLGY